MRTWLMPAEVLFFRSFLLCPCDTLCFCAEGHTWSGAVSLTCNIIGCPLCDLLRANSYPCWTLRSGNWMCCSRRLPSVLCSLFPSSKYTTSSHSWKCSLQMPEHHSSIVTWWVCPPTALSLSPHRNCPVRMFSLQKPSWPWALTRLPPDPHSAASGSLLEEKPLKSWQSC